MNRVPSPTHGQSTPTTKKDAVEQALGAVETRRVL
jgi:hypothetical protein